MHSHEKCTRSTLFHCVRKFASDRLGSLSGRPASGAALSDQLGNCAYPELWWRKIWIKQIFNSIRYYYLARAAVLKCSLRQQNYIVCGCVALDWVWNVVNDIFETTGFSSFHDTNSFWFGRLPSTEKSRRAQPNERSDRKSGDADTNKRLINAEAQSEY